jgi:hypothetical protein
MSARIETLGPRSSATTTLAAMLSGQTGPWLIVAETVVILSLPRRPTKSPVAAHLTQQGCCSVASSRSTGVDRGIVR